MPTKISVRALYGVELEFYAGGDECFFAYEKDMCVWLTGIQARRHPYLYHGNRGVAQPLVAGSDVVSIISKIMLQIAHKRADTQEKRKNQVI